MAVRKAARSRNRTRGDGPSNSDPQQADASQPLDSAEINRPRSRLVPALAAFGLWAIALITLAVVSANPTTLNRAQIHVAPIVVEAMLIEDDQPRWQVTQSWPTGRVDGKIRIEGLESLNISGKTPYLIPVTPVGDDDYRLVLSPKPFIAPFIYPANPQTISDLEAILKIPPPQS